MTLPKYRCHKEVRAMKIWSITSDGSACISLNDSGHSKVLVSEGWCDVHKPEEGGYYVRGDHANWVGGTYSTAEAFEAGYTLIEEES